VIGAQSGQLTNIDETGEPSIYYHAYPHVQEHDAYSGDYGLGFFGSSLETGSTFVLHESMGALCYLCDYIATAAASAGDHSSDATVRGEETAAAGSSSEFVAGDDAMVYQILPRDAYRQRVFLEPVGLWLQADAGIFKSVTLNLAQRTAVVAFAAPSENPAGTQSYSKLRLRVDQTSRPGET
jgi:hypothetical protein